MILVGRRRVRRTSAGMAAVLALTVVIVAEVNGFTPASAGSAPDPGGINASADAYVSGASPGSNYGSSTTLVANATGPVYTHLQFQVSGSNGATSGTLQVYSTSSGTTLTKVYAEPATWTETGLTYSSQPTKGALLGTLSTLATNSYSTVTVPLTGDGTYAFVLTTTATSPRNMTSRETGTPPQLVLSSAPPTTSPPSSSDPVIVAAGDIACAANDPSFNNLNGTATACRSMYTEQLIQKINPLWLLPLGDEQYNSGSTADFNASYGKTWGKSVGISMPVVGNHEYGTSKAGGYFTFFANRPTGGSGKGYYSYDVGKWHVVAINTECTRIDGAVGCAVGSPQEKWLKADLAAHPTACTLVYGHRPRWASNSFASADIAPLISDMVAAHVDLYLTGHAHSYERFNPQDANGAAKATGLTQLTVGTGGAFYTGTGTIAANSVKHQTQLYGVEKLVLHSTSWDYSFMPENSSFTDSGTGTCH